VDLSRASRPANDSERLLFGWTSHNLIRLDCQDQLRPDLAATWTTDEGGKAWTFHLADSALSGTTAPHPAAQVVEYLRQRWAGVVNSGIDSILPADERDLRVFLGPGDTIPGLLADPASAFPDSLIRNGTDDEAILRPSRSETGPVLEFRLTPRGDPRDALDRGIDLLVTRSMRPVDYAQSRPGLSSSPLPWSRTYLLVQPEPADSVGAWDRQALARDAVEADARAAGLPPWLSAVRSCPPAPRAAPSVRSDKIAYELGDDVGRGLAERIVALSSPGAPLRSLGLAPSQFTSHLEQGSELAYVVAVPSRTLVPCRYSALLPPQARIEPLIETRAHVILRDGVPPLTVEWDGTPRPAAP